MKNARPIYNFTLALSIFVPFFLIRNVFRLEVEFFQYYVFTTLLYILTIIAVNFKNLHFKKTLVQTLSFFVFLSATFHLLLFILMLVLGVNQVFDMGIGFIIFAIFFQITLCGAAITHMRSKKESQAKTSEQIDIEF
jgi:hypothetical protein